VTSSFAVFEAAIQ